MNRKLPAALLAATFVTLGMAGTASAKTTIRIATLAPKHSPWGKVFSAWSKAVDDKTKGDVDVEWLWNGTAGPEANTVGKIRSGQITGAAITAVGLSEIYKPIVALQMPGAFQTWAQLDKAREQLRPEFDKAMNEAGFYVGGWGDVGIARTFTRGYEVKVPEDLRGRSPGLIAQDIIGPKVFEAIGGITPKPADVNEFLPLLNSGAIDELSVPALPAEQLQWTSRLDHVNTGVVGFGVGAVVLSNKELERLPADEREILEKTGAAASEMLTKIIRKEDDESLARLEQKMAVHNPTPAEHDAWDRIFKKACQRVKAALPGDVLTRIGYC